MTDLHEGTRFMEREGENKYFAIPNMGPECAGGEQGAVVNLEHKRTS